MAVKKIGTLNKHENPSTNENEFDIEDYMNANWDKIKEVVDNNADELSETQTNKVDKVDGKGLSTEDYTTAEKQKLAGLNNYDDTKIKEDIQDIKSEQTTQNTKLQELEDNQIHITTERASNLNVQDASGQNAKIKLFGISKQEGTPSPKSPSEIENTTGNVKITSCNKNLFNKETAMQNYILNDAGIEIASQGAFVSDYILVKKDVNYFSNTRGYTNAGFYDLDKNFIKRDTVAQNATTTFDDDYYIKLNGKMENIIAFQFERNNTATDFEENEEEVKTFPLAQNQKMYKNSETKEDGIHHKRKQVAFDGTENWALYAGYANNAEKGYCYYLNIADCKIVKDTSISTHFKNVFGAYQESVGYIGAFSDNLSVKNKYFISDKETLEKFKAYLAEQKTAGTPVKLEYELETEEIEAYTEEQQTQRDQLQNAKTYKTVTNVFTDNAEVEMNYIADTKTYVDNEINSIKNQLNTINELLSTTTTSAMLLDNMQTDLESEVL